MPNCGRIAAALIFSGGAFRNMTAKKSSQKDRAVSATVSAPRSPSAAPFRSKKEREAFLRETVEAVAQLMD